MSPKTLHETQENYIIGTIPGAYKQKRHWIKKGFDEKKAIINAVKWALSMLDESSDPSYHALIFREIEVIAGALASDLEKRAGLPK